MNENCLTQFKTAVKVRRQTPNRKQFSKHVISFSKSGVVYHTTSLLLLLSLLCIFATMYVASVATMLLELLPRLSNEWWRYFCWFRQGSWMSQRRSRRDRVEMKQRWSSRAFKCLRFPVLKIEAGWWVTEHLPKAHTSP